MARHELWTHGAGTVVEIPGSTTSVRHVGWGTQVTQAANTANWFHLVIPAITTFDGNDTAVRQVRLRATVNENARIDTLHCRVDGGPVFFSRSVSFTDRIVNEAFQTNDTRLGGGLVMSVHVTFLSGQPIGSVTFNGAGAVVLS